MAGVDGFSLAGRRVAVDVRESTLEEEGTQHVRDVLCVIIDCVKQAA